MALTSLLGLEMLLPTTLGNLLLLYVRCCLGATLSLVGTTWLWNWAWSFVSAAQRRSWDDLPECLLLLLHHHHPPWCLTPHCCSHHLCSRSLPPLSGSGGGIHGPSGPWHCSTGLSLPGHAQPASTFLMVSTSDHHSLFFWNGQWQFALLFGWAHLCSFLCQHCDRACWLMLACELELGTGTKNRWGEVGIAWSMAGSKLLTYNFCLRMACLYKSTNGHAMNTHHDKVMG